MYWLPKVMVNTKVKWWGITKAQINRSKRCPKRRNQRRPVFSVCERPARKVPQQKQATEWVTGLEFFRKWQQGAKLTRTLESKSNSIQWNHRVRTSTAPDLQRVGTRGGTITARGRRCPGAGRTVQVAGRPQGGEEKTAPPHWGQRTPFQTRGSWHSTSPSTQRHSLPAPP